MNEDIIELIIIGVLLVASFFTGSYIETSHLNDIKKRERVARRIPFVSTRAREILGDTNSRGGALPQLTPTIEAPIARVELVYGSAVVGADYFKTTLASIVSLFGGNLPTLESVLDRARREAVLRLIDDAKGSSYIANVRYETSVLSEASSNSIPKVEVLAYGTAVYLQEK